MYDESVVAIARIPLARAPRRMLTAPALLLLVGVVAAVAGWLLLTDMARIGAVVAGAALGLVGLYLAAVILSVRLEVEVSTLRLRRIGADQRFTLVRGAVTRVPLVGEGAARLQSPFGALGWGIGSATLRGDERINLIRLAPSSSMILVPTDAGRVGIAPASEEQLIAALGAAARVQQRLDQISARARSVPPERVVEERPRPVVVPAPLPPLDATRVLTGIERVLLEERLAAERAVALAAAEAERRRAEEEAAAVMAAMQAEQAAEAAATSGGERRAARITRPTLPAIPRPILPRPSFPRIQLPTLGRLPQQTAERYLVVIVPLLLATIVWAFATVSGALDLPEDEGRLVALTLALAGPAAGLGALVARAWFPRLLGLVAVTSVCALILAGRALLA